MSCPSLSWRRLRPKGFSLLQLVPTAGLESGVFTLHASFRDRSIETIRQCIAERALDPLPLAEPDADEGFILDGFPRTEKQALDLEDLLDQLGKPLDAVVQMDVDFDILLKRLTGRRTCSLTGKLLNIYFSTQEELEACTSAGGELIQRDDDNAETIKSRLEVYHQRTEPLIEYYRSKGRLKIVDADGSIDEVYERLSAVL